MTGAKKIRQVRDVEREKFRIGPGFALKVGIRNPEQSGRILSFDIQPVTYPTYRAINNKTDPEEELSISNPSATAEVLLTTESEVVALTLNEEYMDAIWLTPEAVIEWPKIYHPALIQMARDLQAILNP